MLCGVHDFDLGILILRVAFGIMMFAHGWNHFFGGGRLPGAGRWFDSLGIRPGLFHAWTTAVVEVGAGAMFAFGLLTPLAAAGMIGIMTVAGIVVHRPNGFFIVKEGWEYAMVICLSTAAVALMGPGRWSLDHALDINFRGAAGLVVAVVLGVGSALGLLAVFWRPPVKS